jgi:hypothetical protein
MRRLALMVALLAGCLDNPTVEVDQQSLEMPQGTAQNLVVSLDGAPVESLYAVAWLVDDPEIVSVTPEYDGKRIRVAGANPGATTIHVASHGVTHHIPVRVGDPAIVYIWIEPSSVTTTVGAQVQVKATGLDTIYRLQDVTLASYWSVRDEHVANLDMAGMMLQAMGEGHTTLHATFGEHATHSEITIVK